MSIIKGQNLRVTVGGKCIAYATSCTFHIAADVQDVSTKDDTFFNVSEVMGLSWDASTDSLVTLTDPGSNGELPADIFSAMISMTKVQLSFDQTAGTNNRTGQNSALKKTGDAYITDVSITAANRQSSTMTVQFSGAGQLS